MENLGNYLEITTKSKTYLRIAIILFIGFFILRQLLLGDAITRNILLNEKRHTIVTEIYKDRNEHNFTFVKFSNGNKELLDFPYKIGDSVSKNKGDSIEYIFRNKKVIRNNWLKNYIKNHQKQ